jgi:DNA-directed RNA polymerase specialized sigma24 family protein
VLLRHKLPDADLETGLFYVLVTVARAVREGRVRNDADLLTRVRTAANAFVEQVMRAAQNGCSSTRRERLEPLGDLTAEAREVLIRFYHLDQTERQISSEMNVAQETIRSIRKAARDRFLAGKNGMR